MRLRINFDIILIYLLGGLLGLITALITLHLFHILEIAGREEHTFLYHWWQDYPPTHGLTITVGFILMGFLTAGWTLIKDRLKAQKAETKTLEEISQAKTEFVAFTTHQLRTPLSGLRLSLKMFQEGDFGKLNAEQQKIAQTNLETMENLMAQISNLLDISKIELGQVTFTKSQLPLEKFVNLVKELLEKYRDLAEKKNILLDYFVSKEILRLSFAIDWDKIKQVFEILLDNAINYTPPDRKIFVKIRSETNFLTISVADTGIGIPSKEQEEIFTKFFRASNAKKVLSRGSGLGLYLAKFFVESHRGKIWFESKEGWGTTFYFTLPYYQPKVAVEKVLEKL